MNTQLVPGSLGVVAQQQNRSLAETFVNANLIVICDTSGSMDQRDGRNGKSRYETACEELAELQKCHPGKIAVIAFSEEVAFCPNGKPIYFGSNTDMKKALQFTKIADTSGMQFILISDGEPNNQEAALQVARTYRNKIQTIYVGPEDQPGGREFLQKLAEVTGGRATTSDRAKELKTDIEKLYLPG